MRTTTTPLFSLQLLKTFCLAILVMLSVNSFAQNTEGKDFWFAQTPNLSDKNGNIAILVANRSASVTATVTISNPVRASVTRVLAPGAIDSIFFSSENPNIQLSGTYSNNVYHITSDQNIVAYGFTPWINVISNDASLILPTHALGKKNLAGA